jgi:hypothetical protein
MVRVEASAQDEREVRPERFFLAERALRVEEVLDRWFGATYTYFKVRAEDGHTYILKHNRTTDSWELLFSETRSPSGPAPGWPYSRSSGARAS